MNNLPLADIIVEDRMRVELGEVEALAESIASVGLMHPVVVDSDRHLIAGGRRYAAFQLLAKRDSKYSYIPVTFFGSLSPDERALMELEENVRRKSMTWQEQVCGIAKYHRLAVRQKRDLGWTQAMTGDLFGVSQAYVSSAITLAKAILEEPEGVAAKAETASDAIRALILKKQNEASQERLKRLQERQAQQPASPLVSAESPATLGGLLFSDNKKAPPENSISKEAISQLYIEGNCLIELHKLAATTTIHHIITDPPYGISMENVSGSEPVAATHDVEDNLRMLPTFLDIAYEVLEEDGFLCMWYDLDHHEKLLKWATDVGFKVQRWPFVWCKTGGINTAAQFNITKATEVCFFMRKSEKSIIKEKKHLNFLMAPTLSYVNHPFVKPRAVWDYIYSAVAIAGQTVVDPFAGCGSSMAPALRLGLNPIGIEFDRQHIANGIDFIFDQLELYKTEPSFLQ